MRKPPPSFGRGFHAAAPVLYRTPCRRHPRRESPEPSVKGGEFLYRGGSALGDDLFEAPLDRIASDKAGQDLLRLEVWILSVQLLQGSTVFPQTA